MLWCPLIYNWQLPWYYQGIAWQSIHMSLEDSSRTWRLQGPWRVCCGHSMLFSCNYPEKLGSVAIDPSNQWIEFSPCWPIGGKSMLPPAAPKVVSKASSNCFVVPKCKYSCHMTGEIVVMVQLDESWDPWTQTQGGNRRQWGIGSPLK